MKRGLLLAVFSVLLLIPFSYAQENQTAVIVKEQVKCIFTDSASEQKCYTDDWRFSCSGVGSCLVNIEGEKDRQLNWKSSCGSFASTVINGYDKEIAFKCASLPSCPQLVPPLKKEGCTYTPRYDANNCVIGYDEKCISAVGCTDSDGGQNYEVKGTAKDMYGEKTDFCQNEKDMTEYWCGPGWGATGQVIWSTSTHPCPYGCKDGACLPMPNPVCGNGICDNEDEKTNCPADCKSMIKCYQDSDCGQAATSRYCGSRMPRQKYSFDSSYACKSDSKYACQNPGTYESVCIGSIGESCNPCAYGCKDGECIQVCPQYVSPSPDFCKDGKIIYDKDANGCPLPPKCIPSQQICSDSDGGMNYYAAGCVEMLNDPSFGLGGKKCDSCLQGDYLSEYVCENGLYRGDHTYKCPNGCQNGACIKGEGVREQVKCIFADSTSEQRCYTDDMRFTCSGTDSCAVSILANKGEKFVWKSTCGGYAYTMLDGNDEYAKFNCQTPSNQTSVPTTPVQMNNFRNAYWQCQDGKEEKQGSETSCKPSEVWKNIADESCKYSCKVTDKEHKKCAIGLDKENPFAKMAVKGQEYTIDLVSASDNAIMLKIAGSESIVKEIAEGAREKVFSLTVVVNSADPGKANVVVEGEDTASCMKCGVNSFSVYNECPSDSIINPPVCGNGICESGEWEICEITATTCKEGETCKASTTKCRIGCQQDCPKGKEGIYAKLNEKFKLQVSQEAKFKDYQNLVVKFNDLFVPKCASLPAEAAVKTEAAQAETAKSAAADSATGNAVSPFLTEWTKKAEVAIPEKCIENPYAVLQMKFYGAQEKTEVIKIQLGEKKKVFDSVISFLDYDRESRSGVFLVSSDKGEFKCPENCICDIYGQIKECRKISECREKEMLCPDGACRERCEMSNITAECKFGCFYQDKCLPYGLRVNGLYCSISNDMKTQLAADSACENNFECSANICIDGKCVSSTLIQKVIEWLKKLFS